jgi:glycosyltransferase involved in cell wall biosynthesis
MLQLFFSLMSIADVMKKYPVSVFIVTLNEEAHIRKCLQSVDWVSEIILVDSGSNDRTLAIAEEFGAIIHHNEWPGYAAQKQYALSLCQSEWVLNLDGDEALTPELTAAFKRLVDEDKESAVRCRRDDIFIGKGFPNGVKKANNLRFYRRKLAGFDLSKQVHETATVEAKEIILNEHFIHYGYGDIATITDKINHYSSLKAQEKAAANKVYNSFKLLCIFPLNMIKELFVQRKILAGKRGFILAMVKSYYAFLKEAKLYEVQEAKKFPHKDD